MGSVFGGGRWQLVPGGHFELGRGHCNKVPPYGKNAEELLQTLDLEISDEVTSEEGAAEAEVEPQGEAEDIKMEEQAGLDGEMK